MSNISLKKLGCRCCEIVIYEGKSSLLSKDFVIEFSPSFSLSIFSITIKTDKPIRMDTIPQAKATIFVLLAGNNLTSIVAWLISTIIGTNP
ncbi:hypothetical protein D3C86_1728620 [compost metagenome]